MAPILPAGRSSVKGTPDTAASGAQPERWASRAAAVPEGGRRGRLQTAEEPEVVVEGQGLAVPAGPQGRHVGNRRGHGPLQDESVSPAA